ncbi:MAG: hypothetical protein ACJA0U_001039 [Salibacteraceae bacterium]|jgi:hypothetical protein
MRRFITALFCILSLCSFGQNSDTTMIKHSLDGNLSSFDFKSGVKIDKFNEVKWESRYKVIHKDLVEFDLDPESQMVHFVLGVEWDKKTVDAIAKRLGAEIYQLVD